MTTLTSTLFNEARFQLARRGLHYGFSQLPGGDGPGVNITGFAFFGREPFSTVDRIERRYQWTDNVTWVKGRHNVKFGADVNLVQLRTNKDQIFELNFGGVYNFDGLTASNLELPDTFAGVPVPGVTAVQAYGLGIPAVFFQSSNRQPRTTKPSNQPSAPWREFRTTRTTGRHASLWRGIRPARQTR